MPFTPNLVDLGNPAERAALVKLWGVGKFPVLRDDARNETVPESSIIVEYLDRHYRGRTRFIPDDAGRALQTRLRDRFYDLYVHLPMQKIMADRLRPADKKDPHGVEEAQRAAADVLRHDRAADGKRRLGDGRGFQPRRLRRGAVAVLRQHGGAVRGNAERISAAYFERLKARPSFARVLKRGGALFPDGAQGVLKEER